MRAVRRTAGLTLLSLLAAGAAVAAGHGDNPLAAGLNRPHGVWVDPDGTLFIGDSENHRVRALK